MASVQPKKRSDIDPAYRWDLEAMIPDESVLEDQLRQITEEAKNFQETFSGHLTDSGQKLASAYVTRDEIWRRLEKIYVYAHMKRDEDNADARYQALTDQCMSVIAAVSASMAFFSPELLSADEDKVYGFLADTPELQVYDFALRDAFRLKAHVLSGSEEAVLAQMSEVTGATGDIFTMLNNADLTFAPAKDKDGTEHPVTHGSYIKLMESHDQILRKSAYESMYDSYKKLINTIGTAYNYNTKTDVITARLRHYESARAAALAGDNIPGAVYDNLVAEVNQALPQLHRYTALRKKLMGLDKMYMYDMYVPIIELPERTVPFEEGLDIMRAALAPLGEDYLAGSMCMRPPARPAVPTVSAAMTATPTSC